MLNDTHDHTTRCWWNPDQARWVCRYGSTAGETLAADVVRDRPLVNVQDPIVVHTARCMACTSAGGDDAHRPRTRGKCRRHLAQPTHWLAGVDCQVAAGATDRRRPADG